MLLAVAFMQCKMLLRVLLSAVLCVSVALANYTSTIEISLTEVGINQTVALTVPEVDTLRFTVRDGFRSDNCTEESNTVCVYGVIGEDSITSITFANSRADSFAVDIVIADARVGCAEYVFPVEYFKPDETPGSDYTVREGTDFRFTCSPEFVDDVNMTDCIVEWRLITDPEFNNTRNTSAALQDANAELVEVLPCNSSSITRTNINESVIGYYFPTFVLQDDSTFTAPPLLIFTAKILTTRDLSYEVIFQVARNYSRIYCEVRSFPRAAVQWLVNEQEIEESAHVELSDLNSDLLLQTTVDGRLALINVTYNDSGIYTCSVLHPYLNAPLTYSVRLRVKDPLRPLWPAVGIVCVAIITVLFIVFGSLFDSWLEKRKPKDNDETDGGHAVRLFSVTSSDGVDSSNHEAVRRVSSAKQQLLEESSAH